MPYSTYSTITKNVENIIHICGQLEKKIMVGIEEQEPKDFEEDNIQMLIQQKMIWIRPSSRIIRTLSPQLIKDAYFIF